MTDAATQLSEKATFCKLNDEKRPSLVGLPDFTTSQVCPEDLSKGVDEVTSGYPDGWFVRIMFDELLDPNIETLVPILDSDGNETGNFSGSIAASHPVTLQCESINGGMVNVDYDGYYQPAGNRVTWPLGPSLVIKPNDPKAIATNTECTLTINNDVVRDKSGEKVPDNEKGPYKFRIAAIAVVSIDPPDDPDGENPVTGSAIFFDNFYLQFNTAVDPTSLCPENGNDVLGMCDEEVVQFRSATDTTNVWPGKCNSTLNGCNSVADCDAANGDTLCGRGYCDYNGTPCNSLTDCDTANGDTNCAFNSVYSYLPFGLTDREFGAGPVTPPQTDASYIFQIPEGTKLRDRCGKETTFGAPNADDLTLVHFKTKAFDFSKANIATGETASAMKRLQLNWNSPVAHGDDTYSGTLALGGIPAISMDATGTLPVDSWTLDPMPFLNATTPMTKANVMIGATDLSGQIQMRGHEQLGTTYTFTLKAGTVVKDNYGATWTNPSDMTVSWKTDAAIKVTSFGLRDIAQVISVVDQGTLVKTSPDMPADVRIGFNSSMDATTIGLDDISIDPMPADLAIGLPTDPNGAYSMSSGCGTTSTSCTLRLRATYKPGTYKITLKAGAQFKDIFGNEYTQAKDQTITVNVEEAPPPIQCL